MSLVAAILYWRALQNIGPVYAYAMRWLVAALLVSVVGSLSETLYSLLTPVSHTWYTQNGLNLLPIMMTAGIMLVAGAQFRQIADRRISATATPIEVIVYMAQLVSRPEEIDNDLDVLRKITMHQHKSAKLDDHDKRSLTRLYLTIENYLINKETVRKFSRDELRSLLPSSFLHLLPKRHIAAQTLELA